MGEGPNDRGLSRKHVRDSIDASLRRLQVDYVDLYQAHRYDVETPLEETMQAFADVVRAGKALYIGVSEWRAGGRPEGKGAAASLRRLQVDYVDLYQAHRYDVETPLEETIGAFADVVRAGKALYIGVSEWRAEQIREAKPLADELHVPLVSNQPQYSAIYRVIEAEVIPACRELGLSQIVWSPLGQGVLTGKYRPGQPPPEGSRATDDQGGGAGFIQRWMRDEVLERVQRLRPLADEAGLSMAGLALAWVLQEENVASAIIGASRPEQVRDNVKAVGVRLDPQLKQRMDEILAPVTETDPALTKSPNPRG